MTTKHLSKRTETINMYAEHNVGCGKKEEGNIVVLYFHCAAQNESSKIWLYVLYAGLSDGSDQFNFRSAKLMN